jgi:hypothetical protein
MDGQRHIQAEQEEETPEQRQRGARVALILSPVAFILCWIFARAEDASHRDALIIAGASFVMCVFFSVHYRLRGAKVSDDALWLRIILSLFRH